jgi:hypothetical protein
MGYHVIRVYEYALKDMNIFPKKRAKIIQFMDKVLFLIQNKN